MIKKIALYSVLLLPLGLCGVDTLNSEEQQVTTQQETKYDNNIEKEWNKAKKVGYSKETFERIMNIPKQNVTHHISTYDNNSLNSQQQAVINEAKKHLGVPYLWGGTTPEGFDCSGLVQYVYKKAVNINLPRITTQQETCGQEVSLNDIKPGDLLFFGDRGATYHVAIYVGNNQYIHAPQPGENVKYGDIKYWAPQFARRVLNINNDSNNDSNNGSDIQFGEPIHFGKYATITQKGYGIFKDKQFKNKVSTTDEQYQKTYYIKGYYNLSNGSRYYSLYDNNNNWYGYVNSKAMTLSLEDSNSPSGAAIKKEQYAKIKEKDFELWQDFTSHTVRSMTTDKVGKLYLSKCYYNHINGQKYLSLYDRNNNWMGYLNDKAVEYQDNQFGEPIHFGKYATITKKGYGIFKDKQFKNKVSTTDEQYQKTYFIKGYYDLLNGKRYYSLYDQNNNWHGYVAEEATTLAKDNGDSPSGAAISKVQSVKIKEKGFELWQDFTSHTVKSMTDDKIGKNYISKCYYNHINGQKYLSLYDQNNNWIGYLNAKAVIFN